MSNWISDRVENLRASAEVFGQNAGEDLECVWHVFGAGPALTLIHGGSGSWLHWVPVIEQLAKEFRVLIPDMPGFGNARDRHAETVDDVIGAIAKDLRTLLQTDGTTRLAAFSFGGIIGTQIAARDATLVSHLTLIGSAGFGGPRGPLPAMQRLDKLHPNELHDGARANLMALMLTRDEMATGEAIRAHLFNCIPRPFRSRSISHSSILDEVLPTLKCPVHLTWGEQDATIQGHLHTRLEHVRSLLPDATVSVIPESGHWTMQEASEATVDLLRGLACPPDKRMAEAL